MHKAKLVAIFVVLSLTGPERHLKPEKKPADPKEQANHSEKEQGGVSEVSQLML